MPRSIGKVTISFGLVNIPTKLFTSVDASERIAFNQLSPRGEKLKQQYVDPAGELVEHKDMLKGYAYEKGKYVTFTQEEIKAIQEPSTPVVSITSFVPAWTPPQHHDKTYYLVPEKGAEKAYELLRRALIATDRAAVTKHCSHGKQHLAIIGACDEGLMLHHVLYTDEVVPFSDVHVTTEIKVSDAELKMAEQLVRALSVEKLDLTAEKDEVKERMERAIEAKVAGQQITIAAPEAGPDATQDLMAALQRSLAA